MAKKPVKAIKLVVRATFTGHIPKGIWVESERILSLAASFIFRQNNKKYMTNPTETKQTKKPLWQRWYVQLGAGLSVLALAIYAAPQFNISPVIIGSFLGALIMTGILTRFFNRVFKKAKTKKRKLFYSYFTTAVITTVLTLYFSNFNLSFTLGYFIPLIIWLTIDLLPGSETVSYLREETKPNYDSIPHYDFVKPKHRIGNLKERIKNAIFSNRNFIKLIVLIVIIAAIVYVMFPRYTYHTVDSIVFRCNRITGNCEIGDAYGKNWLRIWKNLVK